MIRFHRNDLPAEASFGEAVAIDTETLGLVVGRDRLCVVQISRGDGSADIVQIAAGQTSAPNLERLLADPNVVKLFHYGRFDMAVLHHAFGVMAAPVYCTKIASKIARTYTDRHGLKDLTRELLGVEISKQQQSSDWGAEALSEAQLAYAASDVLHLHACARSWTPCSSARAGQGMRAPLSPICPIACASTSRDSRPWTFSRTTILERLASGRASQTRSPPSAGRRAARCRRAPAPASG